MSDIIDIPMSNPEVAKELGVAASSLRKWCLSLEEHNYNFERTDQNKRLFYHDDLVVLKYFKELVTTKNMSLKNAAIIVTDRFAKKNNKVFFNGTELDHQKNSVISNQSENEQDEKLINKDQLLNILRSQQEQMLIQFKEQLKSELIQELKEEIRLSQVNYSDKLLEAMDNLAKDQEKHISKAIAERDKYLVESLRESLEVKKQIAATTEKEHKKKKWFHIWK